VWGHIAMWHPSVYGASDPDDWQNVGIVQPLLNKPFDEWWFHGRIDSEPTEVLELPAGGRVTVELACNKQLTSMGNTRKTTNNNPCPDDSNSFHAGKPVQDDQIRGCALAVVDVEDAKDAGKDQMAVFSTNHTCVKYRFTDFEIPANMPECSGRNCICAWFW
ncbi:hypothetical protein BJ508DRAFT_196211, partial [Ascobolus immersus RN42]